MKKLLLSFVFFPLFLPSFSFSSIKNVVEGSGDVTVESSVSTTVNGENVTVKSNQPGSVEVKNINGKVEIKTSEGITPTIIITGVPIKPTTFISRMNFWWRRFLSNLTNWLK